MNGASPDPLNLLRMLVARLERLSVDSRWARRASGLRGNLLRAVESVEGGEPVPAARLKLLTDAAFEILRRAAEEIPDMEDLPWRGER